MGVDVFKSRYCVIYGSPVEIVRVEKEFPSFVRGVPPVADRLADGFPLIVDLTGAPVEPFLAFFLSRTGAASSTLAQYSQALVRFLDFLEDHGSSSVLDATSQDLVAYRLYRTSTARKPISDYSFRVEASALRQFFTWAVSAGHLARSPVKPLSRRGRDSLSTNRLRHSKIRHIDDSLYREFLHAAADYSSATSIRCAPERNIAMIRTLVTTGLRLRELASLLTLDIDAALTLQHAVSVEMESITKYKINRNALIPISTNNAIRRYRKTERPDVVYRHQRSLKRQLDTSFVLHHFDNDTRSISGTWQGRVREYSLHQLPVDMRRKSVWVKPDGTVEPLCLFLSDCRGLGMTRSGWEGVFTAVSERMIRQHPGDNRIRKVTPHDLRHTFAINYLRAAQRDRQDKIATGTPQLGPPLRDPLIDLQELLGHATAAQTLGYLRYVEDMDRLVAVAAAIADDVEGARDAAES